MRSGAPLSAHDVTSSTPAPARRKFGLWTAIALVVGNIIASGIFMLPAGLAPFGWNAVSAWGVTFVGSLGLAWVFAVLAQQMPEAGGAFGYMRRGVGEPAAFFGAWGYVASTWPANAGIAITGVSYLTRLVPGMAESTVASPVVALTVIWLLTWVNLRGLRAAGQVQSVTTIIKLLPFGAVIGMALWRLASHGAAALPPVESSSFTLAGTTGAVGLTLFAMLGLESATVPDDAIDKPERNVPRATMIGTGLSVIVSLIATSAVALMLPAAEVAASKAPVSDFIASAFGGTAGTIVAACAVVSCFGALNGWILIGGELPAAMARQGALPPWFRATNAQGAPARALLLGAVVTSLLTLMAYTKAGVAGYNFAILIATATNLPLYALCLLAAARFVHRGRVPRSAGLSVSLVLAMLFVVWAVYGTGVEALVWGAMLMAAGWPVYRLARRAAPAA